MLPIKTLIPVTLAFAGAVAIVACGSNPGGEGDPSKSSDVNGALQPPPPADDGDHRGDDGDHRGDDGDDHGDHRDGDHGGKCSHLECKGIDIHFNDANQTLALTTTASVKIKNRVADGTTGLSDWTSDVPISLILIDNAGERDRAEYDPAVSAGLVNWGTVAPPTSKSSTPPERNLTFCYRMPSRDDDCDAGGGKAW